MPWLHCQNNTLDPRSKIFFLEVKVDQSLVFDMHISIWKTKKETPRIHTGTSKWIDRPINHNTSLIPHINNHYQLLLKERRKAFICVIHPFHQGKQRTCEKQCCRMVCILTESRVSPFPHSKLQTTGYIRASLSWPRWRRKWTRPTVRTRTRRRALLRVKTLQPWKVLSTTHLSNFFIHLDLTFL